ncbi:GNAT family N-acetyltransferase [Nocardioides acrostichi]|uniref:GNAT family N-acetyltransferase n=1 Tax=Nocardioides acrostichi TaxID=2784339 RepID=A0A930Y5P2_9ACTN|nr:GNAT family N-acetyltransferase [Nocardioides acrostichi]MBF4160102.1 GNAT family N-acetyltransferase [Nocardioides acrostichi]
MPLVTEPVRVEAGEFVLRPYRDDDVDDLLRTCRDPEIARWNPQASEQDAVERLVAQRNDWSGGVNLSWVVADAASDALLGWVSLFDIDHHHGTGMLGYGTAPWARRRGVAVAGVLAASRFGWEQVGLHRVQLFHAVENEASCAVARKAGFVLEGTTRQSWKYPDGCHHDEHLHGRLVTD